MGQEVDYKNMTQETNQVGNEFDVDEVYPNSPLIEVVCEIRFPGNMAIDCRRDEFHAKIKDRYPVILVPQVNAGVAMPLTPYRFERADKSAGVMLAMNKFSYYEKKYSGHMEFGKEFRMLAKILGDTYAISKLDRVGWRYVNLIPYCRETGVVPLKRFLTVSISIPNRASDQFENVSIVLISKATDGSITTKIESVKRADQEQEALVLDFDFAMTEGLSFSKLTEYVTIAHKQTRALFESLITDEYRQYLRGEEI